MQKDNSTLSWKLMLRRQMLARVAQPVILETHGGRGEVYASLYREIAHGVVLEQDPAKADHLALQRPTWAVYETESVAALAGGVGAHLPINVLDVDPYGEPWPVLDAFFTSERAFPADLAIVVNDGLRQKIKLGGAWSVGSLKEIVAEFGNQLYPCYLEVCRELLTRKARRRGYRLSGFSGYYCGAMEQMTHYLAFFTSTGGA